MNNIDKMVENLTKDNKYLPNENYPSDHVHLVADLEL